MKRILVIAALLVGLAVVQAHAGEILLPVFTYAWPGFAGNLWYSEISLVNPTAAPIVVDPPTFLGGTIVVPFPCLPPLRQTTVPPHSTVVWRPWDVAMDLGCPSRAVGALLLFADGPLVVDSRVTNVGEGLLPDEGPLRGFGQTIPGREMAALAPAGTRLMLPAMIWHPNACGAVAFDSYVGFANPGDEPVLVKIDLGPGSDETAVKVDGKVMSLPAAIEIPARGWQQVHLQPLDSMLTVCLPPQRFDLLLIPDGPLAVYGSVVDRSTQDPRTILPVELE